MQLGFICIFAHWKRGCEENMFLVPVPQFVRYIHINRYTLVQGSTNHIKSSAGEKKNLHINFIFSYTLFYKNINLPCRLKVLTIISKFTSSTPSNLPETLPCGR